MIQVICGDAMQVLATLPVADCIITDPPYNAINRKTGGLRTINKGAADSEPVDIPSVADALWAKTSGSVYVWCSDEQYTEWTDAFKRLGGTTRKCAWWKSNPSPMNGDKMWTSALELCVYARKPKAYHARHCKPPIWRGPIAKRDGHPTPKPVWLMRELVEASCPVGGLVIDPYCGGGSTLVAAQQLSRRAIGVDINAEYCGIARSKLALDAA